MTVFQLKRCANMWTAGFSTWEMAQVLEIHEARIANRIESIRRMAKARAA